MFSGPTRHSIPNCISIGSAVFAQLTAINAQFKKLIAAINTIKKLTVYSPISKIYFVL